LCSGRRRASHSHHQVGASTDAVGHGKKYFAESRQAATSRCFAPNGALFAIVVLSERPNNGNTF
jgi:hypothetical protein